jgi:hypothetical protein
MGDICCVVLKVYICVMAVQLHRRWRALDIMEHELLLFGLDCIPTTITPFLHMLQ